MIGSLRLMLFAVLALGVSASDARTEPAGREQPGRSAAVVVYLPALPVESATRVASGVTDLGQYLARRTPGLNLEIRAFRRAEDVAGFLDTSANDMALLVTDASLLHDLPRSVRIVPLARFTRGGRETARKIIVARDAGLRTVRDLRGKRLAFAYGSGRGALSYVARAVFAGEIAPESWFSSLVHESDDLSATASVLFGRADAALVSESNPLVATHLGKDLHEVFTSGPVSLPVVAAREGALDDAQQAAVRRALAELSGNPEGQKILANLGLDGMRAVSEGEAAALLRLPSLPERTMEIAIPSLPGFGLNLLPPIRPEQLPFIVGLPIVEAPLPTLASEPAAKAPAGSQ